MSPGRGSFIIYALVTYETARSLSCRNVLQASQRLFGFSKQIRYRNGKNKDSYYSPGAEIATQNV